MCRNSSNVGVECKEESVNFVVTIRGIVKEVA
jgi:hypothetical protein